MMIWVDWLIVAIVAVSALISIKRGFVKEALSLASWVAAFVIARMFGHSMSYLLVDYIETPSARLAVAFGILFAATLVVGALINHLVGEVVKITGLTGTDRLFGMVFGVARGLVVVIFLVAVLRLTPLQADPWWQGSNLIPQFVTMEDWTRTIAEELIDKVLAWKF